MYFPFDSLPAHSRIWIYQANRALSQAESEYVSVHLKKLCEQWTAHNMPLHASFLLSFDHFIILAVDEQQADASGCSIDGSVHFLKSLQQEVGIDFFDRSRVAFLLDAKISLAPLSELKTLFENRTLSADTITFNNAVTTKADWVSHWQGPVRGTWLTRYLPKTVVAH
jgi:hypothetical protein